MSNLALSELLADQEKWQDLANCKGVNPEIFFPQRGASIREAKAVCARCRVSKDCLEYSLVNGEKFGIWGGIAERKRRALRLARNRSQAGPTP